jgi:integrase
MQNKINLTKNAISSLNWSGSKPQEFYWDNKQQNLALRITSGAKSFVFQRKLNGKKISKTIGRAENMSVEEARERARKLSTQVDDGIDPNVASKLSRTEKLTTYDLYNELLKAKKRKALTLRDYKKCIEVYFEAWRDLPWKSISRDMVLKKFNNIAEAHGNAQANQSIRFLNALGNYAINVYEEVFLINPASVVRKLKAWKVVKPRDNYVSDKNIKPLLMEIRRQDNFVVKSYLEVLLLTGARKAETLKLEWKNINFDSREIIWVDTKNGEDKYAPISNRVFEILQSLKRSAGDNRYVFYSTDRTGKQSHLINPNKTLKKVRDKLGIKCSLHDLRRTFMSHLDALGCPQSSIKVLTGQKLNDVLNKHYVQKNKEVLRQWVEKYYSFILSADKVININRHEKAA